MTFIQLKFNYTHTQLQCYLQIVAASSFAERCSDTINLYGTLNLNIFNYNALSKVLYNFMFEIFGRSTICLLDTFSGTFVPQ